MMKIMKVSDTLIVMSLVKCVERSRKVPTRENDRVSGDSTEVDNPNFRKTEIKFQANGSN